MDLSLPFPSIDCPRSEVVLTLIRWITEPAEKLAAMANHLIEMHRRTGDWPNAEVSQFLIWYAMRHNILLPIPPMEEDKAESARKRGFRIADGRVVLRQDRIIGSIRPEVAVKFTDDVAVQCEYRLIDPDKLQPSHINGNVNPLFFINEAQPKNRTDAVSVHTAEKHARNINPQELLECPNAYSGAPVVNSRGEVIQGNGRANVLRLIYSAGYEMQKEKYKEALRKFAHAHFETKAIGDQVLVRVIITDERKGSEAEDHLAINLGQYTVTQLTTGGRQLFNPLSVGRAVMSDGRMAQLTRFLFAGQSDEDERTLSELITDNGSSVITWLLSNRYITPAEAQTCYTGTADRKTISTDGRNCIRSILASILFNGASDTLAERFALIPVKAQVAILASIDRDIKMPADRKLLRDIQEGIEVCQKLMADKDGDFIKAKTYDKAWAAVRFWKNQSAMANDGSIYYPADRYSSLSLALAACYKGMTQNGIKQLFSDLYDKMSGVGGSMFDDPSDFGRAMTKAEAVRAVLNIDYMEAAELGAVWAKKQPRRFLRRANRSPKGPQQYTRPQHQDLANPTLRPCCG